MKLSIVIATKDRAPFLAHALASLSEQRCAHDFEVIVADNGSTDETPRVVEEAGKRFDFAIRRVFVAQPNRALARNAGVAASTGSVLLFVDDDVWLPPGFVDAHAREHTAQFPRAVSGPILNVASYDERPAPGPHNFSNAFFCTCNVSVRRAAFEAVGGFDEQFDLYGWEDTELGVRLRGFDVERVFAWDAFLYHIKPPTVETLEVTIKKTLERATMAARFVRKSPGLRVRLATGAYGVNVALSRLLSPKAALPLYAGLATSERVPKPLAAFARARLLDGLYIDRLTQALADEDSPRSA